MTTEIRVPQLPESVADAVLVKWHKQPGDAIRRDENLADLETDKVVLEVPAPMNGVMGRARRGCRQYGDERSAAGDARGGCGRRSAPRHHKSCPRHPPRRSRHQAAPPSQTTIG